LTESRPVVVGIGKSSDRETSLLMSRRDEVNGNDGIYLQPEGGLVDRSRYSGSVVVCDLYRVGSRRLILVRWFRIQYRALEG
jgi:hypothetical protein